MLFSLKLQLLRDLHYKLPQAKKDHQTFLGAKYYLWRALEWLDFVSRGWEPRCDLDPPHQQAFQTDVCKLPEHNDLAYPRHRPGLRQVWDPRRRRAGRHRGEQVDILLKEASWQRADSKDWVQNSRFLNHPDYGRNREANVSSQVNFEDRVW